MIDSLFTLLSSFYCISTLRLSPCLRVEDHHSVHCKGDSFPASRESFMC